MDKYLSTHIFVFCFDVLAFFLVRYFVIFILKDPILVKFYLLEFSFMLFCNYFAVRHANKGPSLAGVTEHGRTQEQSYSC